MHDCHNHSALASFFLIRSSSYSSLQVAPLQRKSLHEMAQTEMDTVQDLVAESAAELLDLVRDGGELVIVDNSEVVQSLVECGFEIITKTTAEGDDDGTSSTDVVLQVRGENHSLEVATPQPLLQGTVELSEDGDPATFKRGPVTQYVAHPIPIRGTRFQINSPDSVATELCKRRVQRSPGDTVDQEVYAFLCLIPAYLRNAATQEVTLMLDEVVFGVDKCLKEVHCLGHFVHRLDIKVHPSDAWKASSTLGTVRPGNNATNPVHRTQSRGLGASVTIQGPVPGGQITRTQATETSYAEAPHQWLPAVTKRRGLEDKSVTWTWKMNTWQDGHRFHPHQTWLKARELPKAPFDSDPDTDSDDLSLNFPGLDFDATWEVATGVADALHNKFEWCFHVTIHTVVVRPMLRLRYGKDVFLFRRKSELPVPFEFTTVVPCQF